MAAPESIATQKSTPLDSPGQMPCIARPARLDSPRGAGRQSSDTERDMSPGVLLTDDPLPGVRRLTLNRPEKRNALNNELRGAILTALRAADADPNVKVTVMRGA